MELNEACQRVKEISSMQQFKRSLEFIQGGTNITLDRMILQLDKVGAECFLAGIEFQKEEMSKLKVK